VKQLWCSMFQRKGAWVMSTFAESLSLTAKLEKNGELKFKRFTEGDDKTHTAVVVSGFVVVDTTEKMTWDTFTHLYLRGLPYDSIAR